MSRVQEIRERLQAATPGPWRWWFNEHTKSIRLLTNHSGQHYVMGFARYGTNSAQPLFQVYERYEGDVYSRGSKGMVKASTMGKWNQDYRHDDGWIDHPDAEFIANAPADIAYLLSEIDRLTAKLVEVNHYSAPQLLTVEESKAVAELEMLCTAHPLDDWHEDDGDVLWWKFPIEEVPYFGSPLCSSWPNYHTHWTPFIQGYQFDKYGNLSELHKEAVLEKRG